MLPEGFSNLVGLTIEDWNWDELPRTDSDIWDALLYPIFLGATVRSAQANYVKGVLSDLLEFEAAHAVPNDPIWSGRVLGIIEAELENIEGTVGEGLKRAILRVAAREVESLDLSRTIGTALEFFDIAGINVQTITNLQDDYAGTLDLVDLAARFIHKVRYVKGVLWLYACGIAEDLVPPNAHVTRFLHECGYPGFGWSREPAGDWQVFTPACNCMRDVARQVGTELNQTITPKQAQAAVWYLQTCRGLLPASYRRQLNPLELIDFLNSQRWSIQQLGNKLDDVEQLESLASNLKAFCNLLRQTH